jgi:hypothetical protein
MVSPRTVTRRAEAQVGEDTVDLPPDVHRAVGTQVGEHAVALVAAADDRPRGTPLHPDLRHDVVVAPLRAGAEQRDAVADGGVHHQPSVHNGQTAGREEDGAPAGDGHGHVPDGLGAQIRARLVDAVAHRAAVGHETARPAAGEEVVVEQPHVHAVPLRLAEGELDDREPFLGEEQRAQRRGVEREDQDLVHALGAHVGQLGGHELGGDGVVPEPQDGRPAVHPGIGETFGGEAVTRLGDRGLVGHRSSTLGTDSRPDFAARLRSG